VPTVAELFALALQHHQGGDLRQAQQLYQQILQADPYHADSRHLLGVAAYQLGRFDEAIALIRHALTLNPGAGPYYSNLGLAQEALGQMDEAVASYQWAVRLQPNMVEAYGHLGNALQKQGKLEEAVAPYQEALRLRPDFPEAHTWLGNALLKHGKAEQARAHYQEALRLKPDSTAAHNGLGIALESLGQVDEAICCYQEAVRLNPRFFDACYNLGNALELRSRLDEAIQSYRQAVDLKPDFADAYNNLGSVFLRQGQLDDALTNFQQALRLQPDMAIAQSNHLFCLNYDPEANPDVVFEEYRRWGQAQESRKSDVGSPMSEELVLTSDFRHPTFDDPERPLRIGYVSPDFRHHALRRYFEPVLARHDPQRVHVICYAEVARPDAVTTRLQNLAQGWRWTYQLTDAQLAQCIRDDRIDILVDLAGHTGKNRLRVFARKPAPVQVTWLGYLHTTGLTSVDYRLTDDFLDPPTPTLPPPLTRAPLPGGERGWGEGVLDTEELVRLPGGMCCFGRPLDAPDVGPLPALRQGHLTFGSLHQLFKLNAQVLDLWSEVLKALPTSRLLIFRDSLAGTAQDRIRRQFSERGIAINRLDLRPGPCTEGYMGVYGEIDVTLDTFPVSGGVTTCESLWMGVPVLTLCGERPLARNSAALLSRVGLTDWVVQTPQQYVALAARLGNELDRLSQLRAGLRPRVLASLCDAERFTRGLEEAYRNLWRRWCSQQRQETPNPKPQIPNKSK